MEEKCNESLCGSCENQDYCLENKVFDSFECSEKSIKKYTVTILQCDNYLKEKD